MYMLSGFCHNYRIDTKAIYTIDDIALMYCYILSNRAQQLGLLDLA